MTLGPPGNSRGKKSESSWKNVISGIQPSLTRRNPGGSSFLVRDLTIFLLHHPLRTSTPCTTGALRKYGNTHSICTCIDSLGSARPVSKRTEEMRNLSRGYAVHAVGAGDPTETDKIHGSGPQQSVQAENCQKVKQSLSFSAEICILHLRFDRDPDGLFEWRSFLHVSYLCCLRSEWAPQFKALI